MVFIQINQNDDKEKFILENNRKGFFDYLGEFVDTSWIIG